MNEATMNGNARPMWRLQRVPFVAFAEKHHRAILESLRKSTPAMRRGRIVEVLQMRPDLIKEGVIYTA